MRDIAVIFIESSKTNTPACVLTKYLQTHYEEVYKRNLIATKSHGDNFVSSAPGQGLERETISSNAHHSPTKDNREHMNETNMNSTNMINSNTNNSSKHVVSYMGAPWDDLVDWMDTHEGWDIVNGLNFVQFVDCLSKCGLLAYSSTKFVDALPNAIDKVEHFLIAHCGLAGSSNGGTDWKAKADARLLAVKNKIKSSYGKNFTSKNKKKDKDNE